MSRELHAHSKAEQKPSANKAPDKRSQLKQSRIFYGTCSACQRTQGVLQRSHEALRSPGTALDPTNRASIEPRFAHDFSHVPAYSRSPSRVQAKLTVNAPGDIYEQEANRIADQVMATPKHTTASITSPQIQRFSGRSNEQTYTVPASVDSVLARPGRPLDIPLRKDMESRFGHDFSRVRVHLGDLAERSAREVNAHAYTSGHNIVFGAGQFAPGTHEGRRLLTHELTHVM
ncbi:MAG TPA: DUF4157 domain-containing protein, partial [Methanotrichaceae archaeon]|nr:DUF4157 domain-containing protein [Methanotrichaceae archaeon]